MKEKIYSYYLAELFLNLADLLLQVVARLRKIYFIPLISSMPIYRQICMCVCFSSHEKNF